jgi:hypothetical protein
MLQSTHVTCIYYHFGNGVYLIFRPKVTQPSMSANSTNLGLIFSVAVCDLPLAGLLLSFLSLIKYSWRAFNFNSTRHAVACDCKAHDVHFRGGWLCLIISSKPSDPINASSFRRVFGQNKTPRTLAFQPGCWEPNQSSFGHACITPSRQSMICFQSSPRGNQLAKIGHPVGYGGLAINFLLFQIFQIFSW